ncbi:MAG: hypothetical protein RIS47_66 [Bacteroidota bacterium]
MLHSGHVAFLKEASAMGELYVCIGSDENVFKLKGRYPITQQDERKYMIESLACVHECRINSGWGIIDFLAELDGIRPDIFAVNEDGTTPEKASICVQKGIEYLVFKRIPHANLPRRSTTSLRTECLIPYRIDLAGGWLDQPYVSKFYPGSVLTISIEPLVEFNDRSGMSTSTRRKAIELWKTEIPRQDREQLAKVLFSFENPPGTTIVSGSQDSLGIVLPGLNKLSYDNAYWPHKIESVHDDEILDWIEDHLFLVTLGPRQSSYDVLSHTNITFEGAKALADAAENCWSAILARNLKSFGENFRLAFEAQIEMFPDMAYAELFDVIERYKDKSYGWKLSGAGGGGYLIFVSEERICDAMQIKIRRKETY